MSTNPNTTNNKVDTPQNNGSNKPTAQNLPTPGTLEEDDEFEEFEVEDWKEDAEDKEDITLWDDNWDDDDLEDDFSKQLRIELEKAAQPEAMAISN